MRGRRHQIDEAKSRLPAAGKPHALHIRIVPRHANQLDAGQNFAVPIEKQSIVPAASMGKKLSGM